MSENTKVYVEVESVCGGVILRMRDAEYSYGANLTRTAVACGNEPTGDTILSFLEEVQAKQEEAQKKLDAELGLARAAKEQVVAAEEAKS